MEPEKKLRGRPKSTTPQKFLHLRIPLSTHSALEDRAKLTSQSITAIVKEAIRKELKRQ